MDDAVDVTVDVAVDVTADDVVDVNVDVVLDVGNVSVCVTFVLCSCWDTGVDLGAELWLLDAKPVICAGCSCRLCSCKSLSSLYALIHLSNGHE